MVTLLLVAPSPGQAQAVPGDIVSPSPTRQLALSLGGGDGPGAELALILPAGPGAVVLRNAGTMKVCSIGFNEPCAGEDTNVDVGVLYAVGHMEGRSWARVAVGPSFVRINRFDGDYTCTTTQWSRRCGTATVETERSAFGLGFRLDMGGAVTESLGLGLVTFGNLNGEHTFAVVALSLTIF